MITENKIPVFVSGSGINDLKYIEAPQYATQRLLIRRAKAAHGFSNIRHSCQEFIGPDGCTYLRVDLSGLSVRLLIDVHNSEVEQDD